MKEIFEEYGLFILSAVAGLICISFVLSLFVGNNSAFVSFFEGWLLHFGLS